MALWEGTDTAGLRLYSPGEGQHDMFPGMYIVTIESWNHQGWLYVACHRLKAKAKLKRMRTSEPSVNNEKGQTGTVRLPSMI